MKNAKNIFFFMRGKLQNYVLHITLFTDLAMGPTSDRSFLNIMLGLAAFGTLDIYFCYREFTGISLLVAGVVFLYGWPVIVLSVCSDAGVQIGFGL